MNIKDQKGKKKNKTILKSLITVDPLLVNTSRVITNPI